MCVSLDIPPRLWSLSWSFILAFTHPSNSAIYLKCMTPSQLDRELSV